MSSRGGGRLGESSHIGRLFTLAVFSNDRSSPNLCATFFKKFDKRGLGDVLGDFFTYKLIGSPWCRFFGQLGFFKSEEAVVDSLPLLLSLTDETKDLRGLFFAGFFSRAFFESARRDAHQKSRTGKSWGQSNNLELQRQRCKKFSTQLVEKGDSRIKNFPKYKNSLAYILQRWCCIRKFWISRIGS
jgi:hypothetical protein